MGKENHQQIFSSITSWYVKHRPNYPQQLFELIQKTFSLNKKGRLLDLGCGTGNIALGLHQFFDEVVALDINTEMLKAGQQLAEEQNAKNIVWLQSSAEEMKDLGSFYLVTLGRSFHWLERNIVLQKIQSALEFGGGILILDDGSHQNYSEWESIVETLIARWRKHERNVKPNADSTPYENILSEAGFADVQTGHVDTTRVVGIQEILGQIYSFSWGKPELFGSNLKSFEDDVWRTLMNINPTGQFNQFWRFDYWFAFKPKKG